MGGIIMPWTEPIIDRTFADVINGTSKGYINATDLNRIEGNCEYLADKLTEYGHRISISTKTDWTMQDFPYRSEIDRIRDNVNALINAYYKMQGSPDIRYWGSLDWRDANSLEQNIKNIDILLQRMIAGFKRCGTFRSGQEVVLP